MSKLKTRGTGNASAKLTEPMVCVIRAYYKYCNMSMNDLAALYKISKTQIHRIIHRKAWAWL